MKTKIFAVALGILMGLAQGVATAQNIRPLYQYPIAPEGTGPASVQIANSPLYFTPYVGVAVGRDDNLFLSDTNEKASSLYVVSPGLKLDARTANAVFQVAYQSQLGRYASSEDDNYIDHSIGAQLDVAFDRRNFLKLGYAYLRAHDPRGSTDRGISTRPDRYRLSIPSAIYAFGAPGAAGRLEAYYSEGHKDYLNNREATSLGDRITREGGGAFYWRVLPKTYVLAEARRTILNYRDPASPFSSREDRYFGGVMWEATAATTGTIKIGRLQKKFDTTFPEFEGTSWEALLSWAPRSYSKFDFYTAKTTNEATGIGSFILSRVAGVTWTHSWSSVFTTGVDARFQKDEYQGFDRNDDVRSLGLKVGYKFRRWLTLGGEYVYTQRDSNQRVFEYDRNMYLLTATASM